MYYSVYLLYYSDSAQLLALAPAVLSAIGSKGEARLCYTYCPAGAALIEP